MEFRQSALDDPPPPPPPPQLWLQRTRSELPGMKFHHSVSPQSPPPPPPPLWLQRHPPPPGCSDNLEKTNVNPETQRDADKVKVGKLVWRRKKSSSPSAESSADKYETKREALSPAIGKKVWRCFICQVRTTSEAELKKHFQGNKHRSMEAVLKPGENGSNVGLGVPHEPIVEEHISRSEPLLQTLSPIIPTKCSDENCTPMSPKKKIKSKRKEKEDFAFWCEMCKVGADHESVMTSHLNEKKHLSQHQKETANVDESSFILVKKTNSSSFTVIWEFISLIFDKAVQDPEDSPIYAQLFSDITKIFPPFPSDEHGGKVISVKTLILNMCQQAYEGTVKLRKNTEGGDKNSILKLRYLGITCLIGELFNQGKLTHRILHEIVTELLGDHTEICLVEDNVEVACHLLSRIGHRFDGSSPRLNDQYFNCLENITLSYQCSFELRVMIHDLLDLRRRNWISTREEVKAETVVENRLFGSVDTDNLEVSRSLFSESPTLNQRVAMFGNWLWLLVVGCFD